MISTGVTGLDEIIKSGIPQGSRVLYSLEPGVDGQLFLISALSCALAKERSCLVILPNTTVDAFLSDAIAKCGANLDKKLKTAKISFIDAIDRERIQKSARTPAAQKQEWSARIQKICRENDVEIIFAYFDLMYEDFGLEDGIAILESAQDEQKATLILEHLNLEGAPLITRFVNEFAFDLALAIRSSSRPFPNFNYFTIAHCSWSPVAPRSVPFIIAHNQIVSYIPKIVITGPAHSGKSTFVANATDEGKSLDRAGHDGDPAIAALDYGWLRWRDFEIILYGTPGHSRFDPLLQPALSHAMGVVILIDGTNPETLPRTRELIDMIGRQKIPYVIAANRSDLPGIMTMAEIRSGLNIPEAIPIYPVSAKKRADVHAVLESLIDHIIQFTY